jgi:hypothetical protein
MKKITSVQTLENFGRTRLSQNFFMRDFLYSEIANMHGLLNAPADPDMAVAAGKKLCEELLEPLNSTFGRIAIRSAYRSEAVNQFGNERGFSCGSNEGNYAGHIWDRRDALGRMGATACIVIPWFADRYERGADWQALAWWIHDHLPYCSMYFFPKLCAFNLTWSEKPDRSISSYIAPKGILTRPGHANHEGPHDEFYPGFPTLQPTASKA